LIGIVGSGLAGLAAAARLSREGHQVVVFDPGASFEPGVDGLGQSGGWAQAAGIEVASEPDHDVFTLPAAWRDLFYKSGRTLDAELAKRGLGLAPAPAREYRFSNGATLALPSDRGEQWTVLGEALGEPAAVAWRDLLDHLDDVWQVQRRLGLEAEFTGLEQLTAEVREVLRPRESLARLAGRLPTAELSEMVLDVAARLGQDPRRLPGWHAARLSVERTFGRWRLVDGAGAPQPANRLVELLLERVAGCGVEIRTEAVSAIRRDARGLRCDTAFGSTYLNAVISTLDPAAQVDLTQNRTDGRVAARLVRSPSGGPRWDSWRTLLSLPKLTTGVPGVLAASAWSPGGPDAWAQLLTGALVAYRVHSDLTGADIRPTNKAYRRPRPIPRPRPTRSAPEASAPRLASRED